MLPGLGGLNPAQMKQMMKQLGIKTEEMNANRVIFELEDRKLILDKPNVTVIAMQGQKIYNVVGNPIIEESQIPEQDIKMVSEQAKVSEKQAKEALEQNEGDIAKAILALKK